MSFRIVGMELHDFRNYGHFACKGFENLNILVGPNATGKTNLLEAIELTTALHSFRSPHTAELVRWGSEACRVKLDAVDGERMCQNVLTVTQGKKQYASNGKNILRTNLMGMIPAVMFNPDDLRLVKDGSSGKRRALDGMGEQISKNYRAVRQDYERIIRQKNKLLKEGVSSFYLESINDTVLSVGTQLEFYRQQIAQEVNSLMKRTHGEMMAGAETVEFAYFASWEEVLSSCDPKQGPERPILGREAIREAFGEALFAKTAEEVARGRSLVGPHLDQPLFYVNGRDASVFASQGQQRSVALSFKMAEMRFIQERTGHQPVLLLDDVMSELDHSRRSALMSYISEDTQTFITTTNLQYFTDDELAKAQVFALEELIK